MKKKIVEINPTNCHPALEERRRLKMAHSAVRYILKVLSVAHFLVVAHATLNVAML
jgi:hypothetical protein